MKLMYSITINRTTLYWMLFSVSETGQKLFRATVEGPNEQLCSFICCKRRVKRSSILNLFN